MSGSASAEPSFAAESNASKALQEACKIDLPVRVGHAGRGDGHTLEATLRLIDATHLELQLTREPPEPITALRIHLPSPIGSTRIVDANVTELLVDPASKDRWICAQYTLSAHSWLPDYLFGATTHLSPAALREAGLNVRSVRAGVRVRAAISERERNLVAQLRFLAVGNPDGSPSTPWDDSCLNLALWHGELPVAALRLNPLADWSFSELITPPELPAGMPHAQEVVEIARVCTDPAYGDTDLLVELLKAVVNVLALLDRPYVIGAATGELLSLYTALGFTPFGTPFMDPELGGKPHELCMTDLRSVFFGRGVSPLVWKVMYAAAAKTSSKRGMNPSGFRARVVWATYRLANPLWDAVIRSRK